MRNLKHYFSKSPPLSLHRPPIPKQSHTYFLAPNLKTFPASPSTVPARIYCHFHPLYASKITKLLLTPYHCIFSKISHGLYAPKKQVFMPITVVLDHANFHNNKSYMVLPVKTAFSLGIYACFYLQISYKNVPNYTFKNYFCNKKRLCKLSILISLS